MRKAEIYGVKVSLFHKSLRNGMLPVVYIYKSAGKLGMRSSMLLKTIRCQG